MNTTKKLAIILLTTLLGASGLLFGCQNLYSKMQLEVDVEEIVLYISSENTEEIVVDEVEDTEQVENTEDTLELGENQMLFKASISNLPKNVSNNLVINYTTMGVVTAQQVEKDEETNETTFLVTALRAGSTTITVKTVEGAKEIDIAVTVIEEVEDMQLNTNYSAMTIVGEGSNINAAQALKFLPATTNQKAVVYSLVDAVEGITITESGYILVEQKTTDFITVRATNVANEELQVDISVRVIEPILLENISLKTQDTVVDSVVLATNKVQESQKYYDVEIAENSETLNVILQVNTNSKIDIEKLSSSNFLIRSIELGHATLTARVEVIGYESYFVEKQFAVEVLEYPSNISINNVIGNLNNQEVFDSYTSQLGTPFTFRVGAIGAYDKTIKLMATLEDLAKIEVRHSGGELVNIVNDIFPNNITLYIKAKTDAFDEFTATASIIAYANATIDMGESAVSSTLNMLLKRGAENLEFIDDENQAIEIKNISLKYNESTTIKFRALPSGASLGNVTLIESTTGIISKVQNSQTQFTITAINKGTTRLLLISSNGINKIIELEVYKTLENISLDIASPEVNSSVADVKKQNITTNINTLTEATIAVGSGMPLIVNKYPMDANIVSMVYSSSQAAVATISTSGYIVAKSLGTTTITVKANTKVYLSEKESIVGAVEITFILNVYMPIISTQLNHFQYELFDANTLGYYETAKSKLQLDLNINPINATFNKADIVWSTSSSYATVTSNGLVQVSLPSEINFATVTVTATIKEYARYYTQKSIISVRKPTKVSGISILNLKKHLYFDARKGLGEDSAATSSFKINSQVYPVNASNKTLIYRYVQEINDQELQPVVIVLSDGTIIPNRVGNATVYVIAQDSFSSVNNYSEYIAIPVRVADGSSEDNAIEISSAQDFFNINTIEGLSLHYVLTQTIDLSGFELTPIGIIDDIPYGFSGVINGYFAYETYDYSYYSENQIIGANFSGTNTDRTNRLGLFALLSGGTIKNLTFRVNTFNFNLSNNTSGTISYVGVLAGMNNGGLIENVKVQIVSSNLNISTRQNYIGGIIGYNTGQIINSSVSGNLNVSKVQGATYEPVFNIGGMAGYNTGSVLGNFDVAQDTLIDNYGNFNAKVNISYSRMLNILNTYGGIVGYNLSTVEGVTSSGKINGYYNVGGAIGRNTGIVNNVLSASFVEGVNNVGGLVGIDSGSITNSLTLILDQFELDAVVTPQIKGVNNVGGLVGYAVNSTINYSYVKSFYTRAIDNVLYFGDIVINIPENYANSVYVGGLVGFAEQVNINSAYSHLNLVVNNTNTPTVNVYGGGILGANSILASIQNVYTKGNLASQANAYLGGIVGQIQGVASTINKTYSMLNMAGTNFEGVVASVMGTTNFANNYYLDTTAPASAYGTQESLAQMQIQATYLGFGFVNSSGEPFDIDINYNDGTPFIVYANGTTKMLIQAPTAIDITVDDGIATEISSLDELKNNHFKLGDKKAAVYYYQNGGETLNTYSLDNTVSQYGNPIISKIFTPSTVNVNLVGFISSDKSVATITVDGLLRIYKEGVVKITIYSILDKNVFDEIEIAVIKPITNFNIYEEDEITGEFVELEIKGYYTVPIISLNSLKRLYPVVNAEFDGIKYDYNSLAYLNYYVDGQVGVSFEGFDWVLNNTNIGLTQAHILKGDNVVYEEGDIKPYIINVVPKIAIQFEGETQFLTLDFLQKDFNIKVVEGSINLELSSYESNISLKDIFIIDVMLESDIADTAEPYKSVIAIDSIDRVVEIDGQIQFIDAMSELSYSRKDNWTIEGSIINESYEFEIVDKYAQMYDSEQTYIITFASYDRSVGGEKIAGQLPALTKQLTLNIIPQEAFRIDMNYYATNEIIETGDEVFYNPNEVPSTSIIAGKIGLLKMAIYPDYANIDYVELKYTSNKSISLSMEQVAFTSYMNGEQETLGYTQIFPQAETIANGIRLRLISNKDAGIYSYDGNIYVRILIASEVGIDTEFMLTATVYTILADGSIKKGLEKPLQLDVEPASQLLLKHKDSVNKAFIATGTDQKITLEITKFNVEKISDIKWIKSSGSADIKNGVKYYSDTSSFTTYYQYDLEVNSDTFDPITLQAYIEKTINNNKQTFKSNVITIIPTLFTIEGVSVQNVNLADKYFAASYGGAYELKVNLEAEYDEDSVNKETIETTISNYENLLSYDIAVDEGEGVALDETSTWYKRLFTAQGAVDEMLIADSEQYINYKINKGDQKLFVEPKRISSDDTIVSKIKFKYDYLGAAYDGIPKLSFNNLSLNSVGLDYQNFIVMEFAFKTQFYLRASEDKPIPIYTEQDLRGMQDNSDYILMQDLHVGDYLTPWQPLTNDIRTLDGNGFTITISNFAIDYESSISTPSVKNFGLFNTITQNTTLKNVKVNLLNMSIGDNIIKPFFVDAKVYPEINFGAIAGINNGGIIYNSSVTSSFINQEEAVQREMVKIEMSTTIGSQVTNAYIGGLVGKNLGYINNSRSDIAFETNKGYVAGIAAYNSGTIVNSYYKEGFIKNTSKTQVSAGVGGVVVFNSASGKIRGSYVEGRAGQAPSQTIEFIDEVNTGRIIGGGLEFPGDLAGFVYQNDGSITDSYANIKVVSQSRSAGFVFNNTGIIKNSYSMSKVAYNVAAHTPFTGTNNKGEPNSKAPAIITNSYYLDGNIAGKALEIATNVAVADWGDEPNFVGFSFSKDAIDDSYGIWQMKVVNGKNTPYLVSANVITESRRILASQEIDEETNETDFEYTYITDGDTNYTIGTALNPHIIQNSQQFNAVLTEQGTGEDNLFIQHVRIIKDFAFNSGEVAATSPVNFAGVIDGNGMKISNISVVSSSETHKDEIGLFKKLTKNNDTNIGTIKSLNLQFNEVFANDTVNVGSLAGVMEDARVYNLSVIGEGAVVEGKNIVGGVVGKITGDSHLVNLKTNISVNSSYRETVNVLATYDIYDGSNDNLISYAGAVAGVVDTVDGVTENISVTGNSSVIGENVGGAFGLVGKTTTVNTATVEVVKGQFLRTTKVVGGVVGENRGTINNATIRHTTAIQATIDANRTKTTPILGTYDSVNQNITLFAGVGQVAGGLVGFNNGGTILNSISKVDVRNANILVAGGLVGRSVGGSISNAYAYGSVLADHVVGGLVGAVTTRELLISGGDTLIKSEYVNQLATSTLVIDEVFAYNNWLNIDHGAITNAVSGEAIVIGGLIGAVQLPANLTPIVDNNKYINSIYNPLNYTATSSWYLIDENGYMANSLTIVYEDSNKLQLVEHPYDYNSLINSSNELARGIRVYDLIAAQLFPVQ